MSTTNKLPRVAVIIPTLCDAGRRAGLLRAIDTVLTQDSVELETIILVNGDRYDPELLAQLRTDPRLRVVQQQVGSLPAALRNGRMEVTSDYFAFLDDDDEYLPGALRTRVAPMLHDADLDAVATNGYRGTGTESYVEHPSQINRDPFGAMIRSNWLASCGGLFRSAAIHADYFDGKTKYFEWTLLAFRVLYAHHKVKFIDVPTYRVNDSPGSLSKSLEYQRASAGFIEYLMSMDPPRHIRRELQAKLAAAWHDLSDQFRKTGDRGAAWQCHLRSLIGRGGLKYLPYTRRLMF